MIVTGTTNNSRLIELRKYTITDVFEEQYHDNGSWTNNGVDFPNSVSGISVVYYINAIRYIDETLDGVTTTYFNLTPINDPNFINVPYFKNPNKSKIISNPKIFDDVFIDRSDLSALDKNYRLEYIRNLIDLTTYAGGNYFNIKNNT